MALSEAQPSFALRAPHCIQRVVPGSGGEAKLLPANLVMVLGGTATAELRSALPHQLLSIAPEEM